MITHFLKNEIDQLFIVNIIVTYKKKMLMQTSNRTCDFI